MAWPPSEVCVDLLLLIVWTNALQGLDSDKPVHFVDLPGHPRLVDKLEDHIHGAAGIIFVIDSTDFIPYTRDIAE